MKLNKKDFNKLKQLDRIEYRQKKRIIEEINEGSIGLAIGKILITTMIIFCLIIPQGYTAWGIEFVNDISDIFECLIGILFFCTLIGFVIDVIIYMVKNKQLGELNRTYFKMEVKK